jgi:dTDP-glucose pyrophosphorylase/CBS domain-containing protein
MAHSLWVCPRELDQLVKLMLDQTELCQVSESGRLVDAMLSLDRSALEIVLVTDSNGRLLGTMTDGDIRRALLKGAALDTSLAPYFQRQCVSVSPGMPRESVLDLMQALSINQIPIVDEDGRVRGLHLLQKLIGSAEVPNWAVIMAGGKGTRLRPLTEHVPKPMLLVAGRPILERLVLHLVGSGIRTVFISINYLGHMIEEYFGNGDKFGCRIEYIRESEPLGTGGSLVLLPETPKHPMLVLNGDLVTQVKLGAMLEFHQSGGYMATLGTREYSHVVPFGCLNVHSGRIVQFEEKPVLARLINTGIYVIDPALLERIPKQEAFPITNLVEDCLCRNEPIGAFRVDDDWIDIGQREQLRLAREGSA